MIYRISALLLLFFYSLSSLNASDLVQSRTSSYYKYIYRLNPKEARSIYKHGLEKVDESYFHHLVDSVPNDSVFNTKLPQGNYLLVWAQQNELQFELRSYSELEVMVHNNYADLLVTISDTTGMPIKDAKVAINGTRISYKSDQEAYCKQKTNKRGWLEVNHNGFTTYYFLGNTVKKGVKLRKVLSKGPVKYVYVPVRIVALLPYDLVKSIYKRRPYGGFYYAYTPFKDVYLSIFRYGTYGWINRIVRKFEEDILYKDYKGYLVYSKPKYKPNDTIRFKAFVSNKDGKPLRKQPLIAVLNLDYNKKITLDTIQPNRKGAYDYEFVLHDSLGLKLDKYYTIKLLKQNGWDDVIQKAFKYEDYELNSIKYTIRPDAKNQLRGQPFYVHLKGEDMNGLNVPDGRVEINILSHKSFSSVYGTREFLSDTIFTIKQKLDPVGETSILLPDSMMPQMDFLYTLQAIFRTSDNERIEKTEWVYYYHQKEEIELDVRNDSLQLKFTNLGKDLPLKASLLIYDKNQNLLESKQVELPCSYPVNYQASSCEVRSAIINRTFNLIDYKPDLSVSSFRTNRKVDLQIMNPSGIQFNYFVYKKDKEIAKGYTSRLDTTLRMNNTDGCYISLNYKWGGKAHEKSISVPLYKKQLHVKMNQPQVIFPGQTAEVTVEVTDFKNRPVKDVDLTVYGLTKKFQYSAPQLDYFGKGHKSRTMFNNYSMQGDKMFGTRSQQHLNFNLWNPRMNLDSISYYQFIYPNEGIHTETIPAKDSITQFAPFIYKNGQQQKVHLIFLDYELIYASFTSCNDPFSFGLTPGYHKINIRTSDMEIILDSVYIHDNVKNLISLEVSKHPNNCRTIRRNNKLNDYERKLLKDHFAIFDVSRQPGITYLEQKGRLHLLKNQIRNYGGRHDNIVVGPFKHGSVYFVNKGECNANFEFEGSYKYWIDWQRTKMKSWDNFWGKKYKYFNNVGGEKCFADQIWRHKDFENLDKQNYRAKANNRYNYRNPNKTEKGAGTIGIKYQEKDNHNTDSFLSQILLFKDDNPSFMNIYRGADRKMYDLKPGTYRMLFMMNNGSYFKEENIQVKANTVTGISIIEPDSLLRDDMSGTISTILKYKWVKDGYNRNAYEKKRTAEREIRATYQRSQLDFSNSRVISGNIIDDIGESLPGVSVMIKGTDIGTISDFDGNYTLEVPAGDWTIGFYFIGFQPYEVPLGYSNEVNAELQEDVLALDEVSVAAYRKVDKGVLSVATSTVSCQTFDLQSFEGVNVVSVEDALQGRIAGLDIVSSSGAPGSSMKIRGVSSSSGQPLYIIDGVPVDATAMDIDETLIADIEVINDKAATAIYGSRAINGVVLITTKSGKGIPGLKSIDNNQEIPLQANSLNSIRSNFSDEAYWQPNLVTNKKGKASFITTFPDDITSWKTFALAWGKNKSTGQVQSEVKAFKPVSAQLLAPRFLIEGDSINAIGKMVNYMGDSIDVVACFMVDSTSIFKEDRKMGRLKVDSLAFKVPATDTVTLAYTLERNNGYFDGERRQIPVFAKGVDDALGDFFTMNSDTVIHIQLPAEGREGELYLESDPLNILLDETRRLRNYKHLCNEQASSKLLSLLNEERICNYLNKEFKYKGDINKLIQRLQKMKNEDGLWGWWKNMQTTWWITAQVLEALERAKAAGYPVNYNSKGVKYALVNHFYDLSPTIQLRIMKSLHAMKAQVNLKHMVKEYNDSAISRVDSMNLAILKQELNIPVDIESLLEHKKETLYGNYFWGKPCWSLFYGDIRETILMYKLLKAEGEHNDWLPKIRNYFYEKRTKNGWRNTYESSSIIDVVLDDLLSIEQDKDSSFVKVDIDGKIEEIESYPYQTSFKNAQEITITKKGRQVVFAGWHSRYFNQSPQRKEEHFNIHTSFERNGEKVDSLVAGQKVSLVVDIQVKKKSDYLMLEVPIPSVCSYHNKPQAWWHGQHREYYKDRVSIYYEELKAGNYTVEIELVPRYTGKVTLNPAFMEHMYFPVFRGNNELKQVKVHDE